MERVIWAFKGKLFKLVLGCEKVKKNFDDEKYFEKFESGKKLYHFWG